MEIKSEFLFANNFIFKMIDDRIFRLYTPRKQIRPTRSN